MTDPHYRWWHDHWAAEPTNGWPHEADGRGLGRFYRQQAAVLACLLDGHAVRYALELGCSDGGLFDELHLPGVEYWGVDFRASKIEAFRTRHPALHLFEADAATFRADQRFDLIFSVGVIHLFDPPMLRQHLANAHAMLADDGILLLMDFAWTSHHLQQIAWSVARMVASGSLSGIRHGAQQIASLRHMKSWSRREIVRLGAHAGFTTEFFGSLVIPGFLTARMTKTGEEASIRPAL